MVRMWGILFIHAYISLLSRTRHTPILKEFDLGNGFEHFDVHFCATPLTEFRDSMDH